VRYPTGKFVVTAIVLFCTMAGAQPTDTLPDGLSLDGILMRLQIRRWQYSRNVPDFFADEYVTSEMRGVRTAPINAITESVFRLRRVSEPGVYPPDLQETRVIRRTNGVTVMPGSSIAGPTVLVNAFSNGLTTITLAQKPCYDFTISRHRDLHHTHVFAIDYRMKPNAETTGYCMPWGNVSGQALVDPATFNILHFDMHIPRYPVAGSIEGSWRWSIDYSPVLLDGATFYMPRRIDSVSESVDGRLMWTFIATYRNYHMTNVRSRIITSPEEGNDTPQR